jgi:hypothetical protein
MSDFMNRTAGLGYFRGALVLITALVVGFVVWKVSGHPFDVTRASGLGGESLYWTAILSPTLRLPKTSSVQVKRHAHIRGGSRPGVGVTVCPGGGSAELFDEGPVPEASTSDQPA